MSVLDFAAVPQSTAVAIRLFYEGEHLVASRGDAAAA